MLLLYEMFFVQVRYGHGQSANCKAFLHKMGDSNNIFASSACSCVKVIYKIQNTNVFNTI